MLFWPLKYLEISNIITRLTWNNATLCYMYKFSQNFTNKAFNMLLNTQNIKHRIQNIVHLKTSTFKYNHNHSKSRKYGNQKNESFWNVSKWHIG